MKGQTQLTFLLFGQTQRELWQDSCLNTSASVNFRQLRTKMGIGFRDAGIAAETSSTVRMRLARSEGTQHTRLELKALP
jgi:hypothetical protein